MDEKREALKRQDAFYETIRAELEADHFGKWAVVCEENLVGVYDSNPEASVVILKLAPRQACLLKRIGYDFITSHPFVRVSSATVRDL